MDESEKIGEARVSRVPALEPLLEGKGWPVEGKP